MSDSNRYIKKEIGAFDGPEATLFVYTERLHVDSFFERLRKTLEKGLSARCSELGWKVLRGSGILHLISKWYERRLLAIQKGVGFSVKEKLDFIPVKGRFGPEVDTLWVRTRERFDLAIERSMAYLNWKFVDQPHTTYQRFYVYEKGEIKGLVILRMGSAPEAPVGIIAEVFSTNSSLELARAQIAFALECLRSQGAMGVYCASSLPEYQAALVELGFLRVSTERMVIFDRKDVADALKQPCSALLSKGDHDWDVFPLASHLSFSEVIRILRTAG
jgi:hypothetical protein